MLSYQKTKENAQVVESRPGPRLERMFFDALLYLPLIAIGLVSLMAFVAWAPEYPQVAGKALRFQAVEQTATEWTPQQALQALSGQTERARLDTRLSEAPFWLLFQPLAPNDQERQLVEFASRHLMEIACWNTRSWASLGQADREKTSGRLDDMKAGFVLDLGYSLEPGGILCRARFIGPARLTVLQWPESQLQLSAWEFQRNSGLLEGGLLMLALFMLFIAVAIRNKTYLLFSVWLFVNLRMAALSAGWDVQWFGRLVPLEWLTQMRAVTLALFYALTYALFVSLFEDKLERAGFRPLLRLAKLSCLPLLLLSVCLPYEYFLPWIWWTTIAGSAVLIFFLWRIVQRERSPAVAWYSASITITLFASLYEVAAAAWGFQSWIGSVNSVTAALSSSLLAGFAVAAQVRQEHEQRLAAQAELQHTYEAIPIGLFTLDLEGHFLSANPALLAMLGPAALAPGSNRWDQYFSKDAWLRLRHMVGMQQAAELEEEGRASARVTAAQRFLVKATLAGDRIEGSLQDVTEKSRALAHLEFLALHDPLTRALNRVGMERAIEAALGADGPAWATALAYLNLDRFRLVNNIFGHRAGDDVLRQVCERVASLLPDTAKLGRIGGDEFIVLLPGMKIAQATALCQTIVNALASRPYRVGEQAFHVYGSVGLIELARGSALKEVLSIVDRACRDAKAEGGRRLVVYAQDSPAFAELEATGKLVAQLSQTNQEEALQGLYLEMQPIMSLTAPRQSLNFEVLLRMRDAQGAIVPTGRLIGAAESCGRMAMIDRWVLASTLQWLETHAATLERTLFVCVNLNGTSLNDDRFVQDAFALLERHPDAARRLCLEVTESVALHDLGNTRQFIDRVRGMGAKVALDDFGAGYTSFSYLKDLPADIIKIDGSFVVDMVQHPANIAIVEAMVNLAHNLGMKLIAEWAEDCDTVQALVEIGVDYVQGFAISRARPPEQILAARSAAEFIADESVARYVQFLDGTAELPPAALPSSPKRLH